MANPPKGEFSDTARPIMIFWENKFDLFEDSLISVTSPANTKFINTDTSKISYEGEDGTSITLVPFGKNLPVTLATGDPGISSTGFLSNDNTEIKFLVSDIPDNGAIRIGSSAPAPSIHFSPKDEAILGMAPDAIDLPITVLVNGGTADFTLVKFNSVNFLQRPEIIAADEFSSTDIRLTLKAPVVEGTTPGDVNPDGSQFLVSNNKFGDPADDVTVFAAAVDELDATKVDLTLSTSIDFDKNPGVRYADTSLVDHKEDNKFVEVDVDNDSQKKISISMLNTLQPIVSVDKNVVGINSEANTKPKNQLTANILSLQDNH